MAVTETDRQVDDHFIPPEDEKGRMKQIRKRFDIMWQGWIVVSTRALEDDSFVGGHQWPDEIKQEREADGRPVLTYNLLLNYVNNIVNRVRQDWPQLTISPVEGDIDKPKTISNLTGTKDFSMAEVYMGIIRHIEHVSRADQAYDTSVEHSTSHGFGYFRIINQFNNNDTFEQDIRIKRIKNSYNVLFDMSCEEADFSDMNDAFVFTRINKMTFKKKYPGVPYTAFDNRSIANSYDGWYDEDSLRIAEYYYIDYIEDELLQLSNGQMVRMSEVKDIIDDLEDDGVMVVRRRKIKRRQCMWQKMTADHILEGPLEIPCSYIPVFPVVGKELIINGQVEYHSAITHAKDAQKSYNYWRTAATETVALAPKAPWLLTDDQVQGHENEWEQANKQNWPYLSYKWIQDQPAPNRIIPQNIAAAELSNSTQDAQDMQNIIGIHEASLGQQSNEKSGRAIERRDQRSQLSTYVFPDNLSRAIEHMGRVLIEMIPRIYVEERIQRIRLPGDIEDFVKINEAIKDDETGKIVTYTDIAYGKYDARIDTGPSFNSQREEAKQMMLDLLKVLPPEKVNAISHLIVKNMDWPGSKDVYEILRKMLPDELKTEEEKEKDLPTGYIFDEQGQIVHEETGEPLPPPEPTPEQQLAQKQLEVENKKADADMQGAEADIEQANAKKAEAAAKMKALNVESSAPQQNGGDGVLSEPEVIQLIEQRIIEAIANEREEIDEAMAETALDVLKRVKITQAAKGENDVAA